MKHEYMFFDGSDIIYSDHLNLKKFAEFRSDLKLLNTEGFDIYLMGSYIGYLTDGKTYNDVDFFILSKKIIDSDALETFMYNFHYLCKAYAIGYDLFYCMSNEYDDINFDIKRYMSFNNPSNDVLTLYKARKTGDILRSFDVTRYEDTKLFKMVGFGEAKLSSKSKYKISTERKFYKPIKIS